MAENEMFNSAVRLSGDLAGVFEYDGETGYFYLYKIKRNQGQKVISAIKVLVGTPDFSEGDIAICWNTTESKVGLFIRKQLWAVFDSETGAKYGGNYRINGRAEVPSEIADVFDLQ